MPYLFGFLGFFQLTPAHQIKNPTGSPVGFFLPIPACLLGFPRVLADFVVFPGAQKFATFALSGPIVSETESTPNDSKSARVTVHTHKNQWVTCGLIKQSIVRSGGGRRRKTPVHRRKIGSRSKASAINKGEMSPAPSTDLNLSTAS